MSQHTQTLPESIQALVDLCEGHMLRGEWQAALDAANAATQEFPDDANTHYLTGGILSIAGKLAPALQATREALRLNPVHAGAYNNLGAIHTWRHEYAQAVAAFRRALELEPGIQDAQSGLAYALLALGQFEPGWTQHERSRPLGVLTYSKKEPALWDGKPMAEGTLTLFCEAGLGDMLQFCRLIPLVRGRVGKLVLYLQPYYEPLARLLGTLDGVDEVTLDPESLRRGDACLSVFSLPYMLKATLREAPVHVPYLHVNPALGERWAHRLRYDRRPRVGIAWGGNPRLAKAMLNVIDRRRSIPLPLLEPLLALTDVSFYCLQKGVAAQQLNASPLASRLTDYTADIGDFADTAALIDQLDLTITVDTSVVHLAGALGKPVWMLNRFDSCWRWENEREDAPWYPTLRIFRQPEFGDWPSVVDRVAQELRHWVAQRPPRTRLA